MNRFSSEGSGAQLSGKVTLKHAHGSRFAHPTATFNPSIRGGGGDIIIDRPTHWCQNIPNPPLPPGAPEFALARNVSPEAAHPSCCSPMKWSTGEDWAFFRGAILLTWCRCS
jgi:hypothetical protein